MLDRRMTVPLGISLLALVACQPADQGQDDGDEEAAVIEIAAKDFEFEAPRSIRSGWNTIRFRNESEEQEHFVLFYHLPEDKTFADWRTEVTQPFLDVWSRYDAGELSREETLQSLGEAMAPWAFQETNIVGGAGLTEPGRTSLVTLFLAPGTYVMECYVKTPQGTWHTERGMLRELTVTEESTGQEPPNADVQLTLSNYEIQTSGSFSAGEQVVAVHVTDTPEGLLPHDLNLFRLDSETTVEEIVAWMDWLDLEGYRAPAPGVSVGGVKNLMAGRTGYVTVDLAPGRYAWVSEGYGDRGMVEEFVVE